MSVHTMSAPQPLQLDYEKPEGRPGAGAYLAAGAAVAVAMLVAVLTFRAIDRMDGFNSFPFLFRLVASGVIGVVTAAAVAGWVSLLVALAAASRRAGIAGRRSAKGGSLKVAGNARSTIR